MAHAEEGDAMASMVDADQASERQRLSAFARPEAYRIVIGTRNALTDLLVTVLVFIVALCYESFTNTTPLHHSGVPHQINWLQWHNSNGTFPALPVVVATIVFAAGFRIGRITAGQEPSVPWLVKQAALYLCILVLGAVALTHVSGSLLARYVPIVIAVIFSWRLRRRWDNYRVRRARRPTEAGFRPSWRAMCSWRRWLALRTVDLANPRTNFYSVNITNIEDGEEAALFHRKGDHRSEAYCLARSIENLLIHNMIADAENRLRTVMRDEHLAADPTLMATYAQFLTSVGQHAEALSLLLEAGRKCRRLPAKLQILILNAEIDNDRYSAMGDWQWSDWRRARMVWRGQIDAVVLGLAADARAQARHEPMAAKRLASLICRLPDRLASKQKARDLALPELQRMQLAQAIALETIAEICEMQGRHDESASKFSDSFAAYAQVKDRFRSARCLVQSYVIALDAGRGDPDQESYALDLIRMGLQLLEEDRGVLREEESRAKWIASLRELYARVFNQLTSVDFIQSKAGELALWLLESLHRSMTADLMRSEGALESDTDLLAAFTDLNRSESDAMTGTDESAKKTERDRAVLQENVRLRYASIREAASLISESTDVGAALRLLGRRIGILYHCWREDGGWIIHSVLVSAEHGIRSHRTCLPATSGNSPAPWTSPAGIFDHIHAGDPLMTKVIFSIPLDDEVWSQVASALFPPEWGDALALTSNGEVRDLLIVPDGPIASLPLGVLPMTGGRPLLESVALALTPALSLLEMPSKRCDSTHAGVRTAIVHLNDLDVDLAETAHEAQVWRAVADSMIVISTASRAELEEALQGTVKPDIVAISVHGTPGGEAHDSLAGSFSRAVLLRDRTTMSAAAALGIRWPEIVLLGACWVSGMSVSVGLEPFGFPLACLLRGASTVIGGVAPIPDLETAQILGDIIRKLPNRVNPVRALREAQLRIMDHTEIAEMPVRQIAGLAVWSIAAADPPWPDSSLPLHWNIQGRSPRESEDIVALPVGPNYSFEHRDAVESLLREAACHAGCNKPVVGRKSHIVISDTALSPPPPSVWFESTNSGGFVKMGIDSPSGPSHYWQVTAELKDDPEAGQVLHVSSTENLSPNNYPIGLDRHDEVRRILKHHDSLTKPVDCSEFSIRAAEAGFVQLQKAPDNGYNLEPRPDLIIRTALTVAQIIEAFRSVPMPLLESTEYSRTWALALLAPDRRNTVTARITDQGQERTLNVTCRLRKTGDLLTDGLLERMRFFAAPYVVAPIRWLEEERDASD